MVSEFRIKAAVWGKRRSVPTQAPAPYEELASPRDWPEEACLLWKGLQGRFEWKQVAGSPVQTHADVVAQKELSSGGLLIVRFRDMGRDNSGRPHTLRIEAVMLTENRVSSACQLHDPSAWVEVTESGDAILQPMLQEPPNEVVVERAGWLLFGDEKTFQFKSDDQPSPVGHYPDRVQKDLEVGGKQRVPNEASRTRSRDVLKMPSVQSSRPRALRYSTWKILAVVLLGWMGWGTLHNPRDPEARKQLQGLQAELDMLSSRIADNEHTVENLKQEIEKKDSTNRADRKAFDEKLREEQNGRKQEEKELKAQLDKLQREISDQAAPRTQPWWGP